MAVDLENRPPDADSDANNPGQAHYDNEFNNLMSREFPQGLGNTGGGGKNSKNGEQSFGNPNDPGKEGKGLDPRSLAVAEAFKGQGGEAARAADAATSVLKSGGNIPLAALRFARSHKKQTAGGAGILGGIILFLIVLFFMMIPLKIENMVTNLQSHFYSSSEKAISDESDTLLSGYIKSSVLPALTKCPGSRTSTTDRSCNPSFGTSSNPVNALYKGWQQGRLETKLANDYGLEFRSSGSGAHIQYFVRVAGEPEASIPHSALNPADHGNIFDEAGFKPSTRAEVRQSVRDALAGESKWKQVFYRYKVGRLLEEKYGIKRCITPLGCKITDKITETTANQKTAAAAYINERVLKPRSEMLSTIFTCLFISPCDETPNVQPCTEGEDCSAGGAPESDTDREITSTLDRLVSQFLGEDAYKIYGDINESGGITAYLAKILVTKIAGTTAGEVAGDSIPYIGWVNLLVQMYHQLSNLGPTARHLSYITNAASMVQLWSLFRTYSDEIHSGNVSATEVGSFTDSLGSVPNADKGGSASAEQTPLYKSIIDGQTPTAQTTQTAGLLGTALAASTASSTSSTETCDNGKPISGVLCAEEVLSGGNKAADAITNVLNSPAFAGAQAADYLWSHSIGLLYGFVGDVLGPVASTIMNLSDWTLSHNPITGPLYDAFKSKFSDIIGITMKFFVSLLIADPFGLHMGGGRTFDLAAGGADVSANDTAHHQLGGVVMTPAQTTAIMNEQQSRAMQGFKDQPMFARMFSTDTPYSLISRLATDIPSGTGSAIQTTFSSFISNPFQLITHSLGSLFAVNGRAFAAVQPAADPFGVSQYGFPNWSSSEAAKDPAAYWDANCSDNPSNNYQQNNTYNTTAAEASNINPNNGMPENPSDPNQPDGGADYCALIKAAVGSAGGMYDTSLLTADDTADLNGGSGSGNTGTTVSGDAKTLAAQILASPNFSAGYPDVKTDLQDAAAGKPGTAGAMTSSAILRLIATLLQTHKVDVSAIQSSGTGHCLDSAGHPRGPNSPYGPCPYTDYHYIGDAVDVDRLDGTAITGRNAPALTVINAAESMWPSGSAIGQSEPQCGPSISMPAGWTQFPDSCNHIHLQVPQGTP